MSYDLRRLRLKGLIKKIPQTRRYVVTPGLQVCPLVGKERIKELKKWVRERMRARFTETYFHTAVLQSAALPFPLLQRDLEWRIVEELKRPPPKPEPEKKGAKKGGRVAEGPVKNGAKPKKTEVPAPGKGK